MFLSNAAKPNPSTRCQAKKILMITDYFINLHINPVSCTNARHYLPNILRQWLVILGDIIIFVGKIR